VIELAWPFVALVGIGVSGALFDRHRRVQAGFVQAVHVLTEMHNKLTGRFEEIEKRAIELEHRSNQLDSRTKNLR
jgi:hypothetical protein